MRAVDGGDLSPEVGRGNELVDRGMNEHSGGVDPGLMAEHVEPDARLGRLNRNAADLLEMAGERAQLVVLEAGNLDAKQVAELQQDLVHWSIASSLADAVHAGGEHLGARAQRHHGVPSAESEVVVKVHDERRVWGRGFDRRNVFAHSKRRVTAHRVGRRRSRAAGLQSLAVNLSDVVDVGTTSILAAEL